MKRALFFSGGINRSQAHERYRNNLAAFYRYLVQKAGYEKSQIRVCLMDGGAYDFDGDGYREPYHVATRSQLLQDLRWLSQAGPQDQVFFLATNHGDKRGLYPWGTGPQITPADFQAALSLCQAVKILVFGQCYAGIFDNLGIPRAVTCFACGSHEESHAKEEESGAPRYDRFLYYFLGGLEGCHPDGAPLHEDIPENPGFTLDEACRYALKHVGTLDTPYYSDPYRLAGNLRL